MKFQILLILANIVSGMDSWICPGCKFENPKYRNNCDICSIQSCHNPYLVDSRSIFSNPDEENVLYNPMMRSYSSKLKDSNAQFSSSSCAVEFCRDKILKKFVRNEEPKKLHSNDPQTGYTQKLERILSEELIQSIPTEIINDNVRRTMLQREMEEEQRISELKQIALEKNRQFPEKQEEKQRISELKRIVFEKNFREKQEKESDILGHLEQLIKDEKIRHVILVDLDNWGSFFKMTPLLPEGTFVSGHHNGVSFKIPIEGQLGFDAYEDLRTRGMLEIQQCCRRKDAADFNICVRFGQLDMILGAHIPILVLSGDRGFEQLKYSQTRHKPILVDNRSIFSNPDKGNILYNPMLPDCYSNKLKDSNAQFSFQKRKFVEELQKTQKISEPKRIVFDSQKKHKKDAEEEMVDKFWSKSDTELPQHFQTTEKHDKKVGLTEVVNFANDNAFEGEFPGHKMQGHGTYKFSNGGVYVGDWVEGKRNGKGTYKWVNGDVYEGDWAEDRMHGKGVLTKANGTVYECDWHEGRRIKHFEMQKLSFANFLCD